MSRAQKKDDKDEIVSLLFNSKTCATLNKKIFVNFYAEDLYFLTTHAGWKITQIYDHCTFKQNTFKKDFVVMNQNVRKTAKAKVGKDFYKLLNNSNFGNDCRNNLGNCKLELLFDGLDEICCIKKFTNVIRDHRYRGFFSIELLQDQVRKEFDKKAKNLDQDDPFYFSMYESLCNKLEEDLEAIELFSKRNKKRKLQQKLPVDTIENKSKSCTDVQKNKMIIEFNEHKSSSVKSISVKSQTVVKCTTRFMSHKLLMFAKLSLKSLIYSLVELLHFPEENPMVASIYKKYQIEQILWYQVLTDTDSTSIQFIIVSDPESSYLECDVRDILFEIFSKTEISKRLDKSDKFWRQFNCHCPQNEKVLGLYEVEHINDPCYVTLAVNPKEYFKYFQVIIAIRSTRELKKVLSVWTMKIMLRE